MKFSVLQPLCWVTSKRLLPVAGMLLGAMFIAGCHSNKKENNGQTEEENGIHKENVVSSFYKYFKGTIGNKKAVLQLVKDNGQYEGILIDSAGQPLTVSGKMDSSQQLILISYQHYNPVDTFTGSFSQPGVFQGFWSDTTGNHNPFVFQEIYTNGTYRWKVYTLNDSLAFDTAKQSPIARIQLSLLWPDKKDMSDIQWSLITDTIAKRYTGRDTIIRDPKAILKNVADSFFYHYKEMKKELPAKEMDGIRATFNWESDASMDILWNSGNLISVAFKDYQYTGGAHGLGTTLLTVFDLKQNKVLTLNDVFKPGYRSKLQKVLEAKLRKEYAIPQNAALNGDEGILFDKHLALTKNFYLTDEGIGFIYNPYEVAPYVVGQIELFVPFSEINDIIFSGIKE